MRNTASNWFLAALGCAFVGIGVALALQQEWGPATFALAFAILELMILSLFGDERSSPARGATTEGRPVFAMALQPGDVIMGSAWLERVDRVERTPDGYAEVHLIGGGLVALPAETIVYIEKE